MGDSSLESQVELTDMLARAAIQMRLTRLRALSGTAILSGAHAPPGYQNIYLPDKEMPHPLPEGGMTPALRAQLARKYNMRPEDYKPYHGKKTTESCHTVTTHGWPSKTLNPVQITTTSTR